MKSYCYQLYGRRVASEIHFPELTLVQAERNGSQKGIAFSLNDFPLSSSKTGWKSFYGLLYRTSPDDETALIRSREAGIFRVHILRQTIEWRPKGSGSLELARVILRGRALCFLLSHLMRALFLHATVVAKNGQGICFSGPIFQGKSTLAAGFLNRGFSLLSDDTAVIKEGTGGFLLQPGAPEFRLWPRIAKQLAPPQMARERMTPEVKKQKFLLTDQTPWQFSPDPVPLKALYVLYRLRRGKISVQKLEGREALIDVLRSFYNPIFKDPRTLKRQFDLAARFVAKVPVRRVSYPSGLRHLPQVEKAILHTL